MPTGSKLNYLYLLVYSVGFNYAASDSNTRLTNGIQVGILGQSLQSLKIEISVYRYDFKYANIVLFNGSRSITHSQLRTVPAARTKPLPRTTLSCSLLVTTIKHIM